MLLCIASLAIALLADSAASQDAGWSMGQINATMCQWLNPRAAVVRDSLYIDGGDLWWKQGSADGNITLASDGNPLGVMYDLNFSRSFNTSTNISSILGRWIKGPNDAYGPLYQYGVMFANDYDLLNYGGLSSLTNSNPNPPTSQDVYGFQAYSDIPSKRFYPGFYTISIELETTTYVTYGGGVSIPAQDKGFYFGGFRAADYGPIFFPLINATTNPNVPSNTLVSVDMSKQGSETFANTTIPSNIIGRANPELVWIPVSSSGALIAIGGVAFPEYGNANMSDSPSEEIKSNITSSGFMKTVAVYDIDNTTWYLQDTSGEIPPATAQGCTVVASASDGSSHNIYWYGGFDGVDAGHAFFDNVYVLSVPSFIWTKVHSGNASLGRAGHKCVQPYPDQMFVVGGYGTQDGTQPLCLDKLGGVVRVFNLSSATFLDSYNPNVWSQYSVPSAVVEAIGGNAKGNATKTSPTNKWNDVALSTLFGTAYNNTAKPIPTWYPYPLNDTLPTSTTAPQPVTSSPHKSGGLPSWVGPVLGIVLGLMALTALVVIFLIWRRRRYLRNTQSEAGTSDLNRHRIMSWVRGMPPDTTTKAATVTTDETPDSNFSDKDYHEQLPQIIAHEAADTQVHEMMDTSRPQELHDTGLTYTNLPPSPSGASHISRRNTHASRRFPRSPGTPRPESPSLGTTSAIPLPNRTRSGVSSLSSRSKSGHHHHYHQVSEVGSTDSSSTGRTAALRTPEMATHHDEFLSPVSPPTPAKEGEDHVSGGGGDGVATAETSIPASASAPEKANSRRSNFEENLDE